MSNEIEYLAINFDYCGTCNGNCVGCFLTEEERDSKFAFLNLNTLKKPFEYLKEKYKQKEIENLLLVFGRGNTFNLPEKDILEISNIVNYYTSGFHYKNLLLEISTSLIGKIDIQIEKAKQLLDSCNQDIRFNVVVNSDIVSNNFWNNLDQFFKAIGEYRQTNKHIYENNHDVLVININPYNLPDLAYLESKISKYPFPINIVTTPLFIDTNDEQIMEKINNWNIGIYELCKKYNLDLNYKNVINELIDVQEESSSIQDVLKRLEYGTEHFYFINKTSEIRNGIFSVLGDLDFERITLKTNYEIKEPMQMYKDFIKNPKCLTCPQQKICISSGGFIFSLINKSFLKTKQTHFCNSGLFGIFNAIENEKNK